MGREWKADEEAPIPTFFPSLPFCGLKRVNMSVSMEQSRTSSSNKLSESRLEILSCWITACACDYCAANTVTVIPAVVRRSIIHLFPSHKWRNTASSKPNLPHWVLLSLYKCCLYKVHHGSREATNPSGHKSGAIQHPTDRIRPDSSDLWEIYCG